MDFSLTKEQQMIKEMVKEFAEKEIKPIAIEL
ncbi:acyl-CoA dehydrogenase family protein, partial [Peribacillus sp. NPDC058002]